MIGRETFPAAASGVISITILGIVVLVFVAVVLGWAAMSGVKAGNNTMLFWAIGYSIFAIGAIIWLYGKKPVAYTIDTNTLQIKTKFFKYNFPVDGNVRIDVKPTLLQASSRRNGVGGVFSFSGIFYAKDVGAYTAFVSDPNKTVLIEFSDKKIAISPQEPKAFIDAANKVFKK